MRKHFVNQLSLEPTSHWSYARRAGIPVAEAETFQQCSGTSARTSTSCASHRRDGEQITVVTSGYITDADGPSPKPSPDLGSDTDDILESCSFESAQIDNGERV